MGLLSGNDEEINLFAKTENEEVFFVKSSKTAIRLDGKFVRIAKGAADNVTLQGVDSEKTILLSAITAFQIKEPGIGVGYMQFVYPGSADTKGGIYSPIKDENTITFTKREKSVILSIKNAVENRLS